MTGKIKTTITAYEVDPEDIVKGLERVYLALLFFQLIIFLFMN